MERVRRKLLSFEGWSLHRQVQQAATLHLHGSSKVEPTKVRGSLHSNAGVSIKSSRSLKFLHPSTSPLHQPCGLLRYTIY